MGRKWTEAEIKLLLRLYGKPSAEIASALCRSIGSIETKLSRISARRMAIEADCKAHKIESRQVVTSKPRVCRLSQRTSVSSWAGNWTCEPCKDSSVYKSA